METLRRLRTEKGLSQARLAARAELDPSTVNQIERGAREASPSTLHKLADALDVSLYELLEGEPSPKALRRSSLEPSLLNGLEDERPASSVLAEALITAAERLANAEPPQSLADVLKRFGILEALYSVSEPLDDLANDPKAWEDLGEERVRVSRVGYTLHQAAKQLLEQNNEYLEHKREDRQAGREAEAARRQIREWIQRLSA